MQNPVIFLGIFQKGIEKKACECYDKVRIDEK